MANTIQVLSLCRLKKCPPKRGRIIALYARGLSTRGIQAELRDLYGAEVSPTLISNVTNSVLEEVQVWLTVDATAFDGADNVKRSKSVTRLGAAKGSGIGIGPSTGRVRKVWHPKAAPAR